MKSTRSLDELNVEGSNVRSKTPSLVRVGDNIELFCTYILVFCTHNVWSVSSRIPTLGGLTQERGVWSQTPKRRLLTRGGDSRFSVWRSSPFEL